MAKRNRAAATIGALKRSSPALDADEALRSVREHVEDNFERQVPLAEAADVAGFERTYFSHYFHKKTGVTYVRWLNALRISRSISFLRNREMSISEVAEQVGYRDLRTFERNFKRFLGCTPSSFRRGLRS
ncbi:MAG: AraC family transcriptional regulator [Acidobacteria bacterium]|nr:MAG: AraC family transcriptional regulator [Acidobacteriota bacterium]REK00214.1 MAG: AraC family transcriptional regulator [Acidobacteriota bacterium]